MPWIPSSLDKWKPPCFRAALGCPEAERIRGPIAMTEAYEASALRHWRDAEILRNEGRHANASQLAGFAAECAIKTALCKTLNFAAGGALGEHYRTHIDVLWDRARQQGLQKRFPGLFAVLKRQNPFHDWSTSQRYAPEGTVPDEALQRHRDWAQRLLGSVGISGARAGS